MSIIKELTNRGILKQITNEEKFNSLSGNESVYIGFDPTAQSLHLGNYVQMAILKRFKEFGFKPIAVLGGATGMIGDPSGKDSERNLLSEQDLNGYKEKIKKQLEAYGFETIDNLDFYKDMSIIEFLRTVGKNLNINYMMAKDSVASRLETGISFTEFSYQLIQGWDFKKLYEQNNVRIQVGGSDQWGNITSGVELIRKTVGDDNKAVGMTTNLLTTSSGKKFGKSEGNALWLDKNMTSAYEMYQYLISSSDEDAEKFLKWLTFIPLNEIDNIMKEHNANPSKRIAQSKLAYSVIEEIHSKEEADNAVLKTNILFGGQDITQITTTQALSLSGDIPTFENIKGNIQDVLVQIGAAQSKREAREFISASAVEINGVKITDESYEVNANHFDGKANIVKRGKKKIYLIKY